MDSNHFQHFAPIISSLSAAELDGSASINSKFRLISEGNIEVCYVPFEYINLNARVVIVGITPGRTQMINAIKEARRQLDKNADAKSALIAIKSAGAFSGAMRQNLIDLLDFVNLNRWLGIDSCVELFGNSANLVQTASVLGNAVFIKGENYNGSPNMTRHPLLRTQLLTHFGEVAKALPEAVFIPLGDKVAEALQFIADQGLLDREKILEGLPHPSGANAERIAYFLGKKDKIRLSVKTDPVKIDKAKAAIVKKMAGL